MTVADAIPVQVSAVSQLEVGDLPAPSIDRPELTIEVGPETWPGLAQVNAVPSVTMLPVFGGFVVGLLAVGSIRIARLLLSPRGVSRKRKLDALSFALDRAQGHVEVGQAARSYLSAWSNHASDPISVLRKRDPQLADELQEAFVALDRADFGGGTTDASTRVVGLLRRLPGGQA